MTSRPSTRGIGQDFPTTSVAEVRADLLARREILLADVREEDPFARGHPLWAANLPLGRIELDAWRRIPNRATAIVLYGTDEERDLAPLAAAKLRELGYTGVHLLEGGLQAWIEAGGEIFIDVNVPSKAFGELVEAQRHTPLMPAEEVMALLDAGADTAVLDARRFDEYQTMSIPTGVSVPGAELVLRVREIAPDPETLVIVNCAGRTRSIIGTQSLINAGIPNRVVGLRNGTIGWTLAGQALEHGASRRFPDVDETIRERARRDARAVAEKAGVRRVPYAALPDLEDAARTVYRFDVRTMEEYRGGHLPGFLHVPGGQLVQETDHYAPVRGARIVLADDDGVRADMSASWLAQMGWETYVVDPGTGPSDQTGLPSDPLPAAGPVSTLSPSELAGIAARGDGVAILDVTSSAGYVRGHVPGAWFALRSRWDAVLRATGTQRQIVVTCANGTLARYAAAELARLTDVPVAVLEGGTQGWRDAGFKLETGETRLAADRIDRYRRPYEGTDAPADAMQAYLDWEYGLVAQLERDGTHFFNVI